MAIVRKWIEVDDECLGPDKKKGKWEMYLILAMCTEYSRQTKQGPKKYIRRKKSVKPVSGKSKKDVLKQLEIYFARPDVFLLVAKPPPSKG